MSDCCHALPGDGTTETAITSTMEEEEKSIQQETSKEQEEIMHEVHLNCLCDQKMVLYCTVPFNMRSATQMSETAHDKTNYCNFSFFIQAWKGSVIHRVKFELRLSYSFWHFPHLWTA